MNIDGKSYRSIWLNPDGWSVDIIDQTLLPHQLRIHTLQTAEDAAEAIYSMRVRGAPLIGATAAYGMALAMTEGADDDYIELTRKSLLETRPTAVNLRWALARVSEALQAAPVDARAGLAYALAQRICDEDVRINASIGTHGLGLIEGIWKEKRGTAETLNILTHCNAGWLATVDWGTALAPIYRAHDAGIPVHVWVDETRPRNQGAALTAWELAAHGVPHDLIVDNAGGHLMQHGMVDLCITGTDRTARNGDVCNKIGTYLKALAAFDNEIPFYVALPGPTIDWSTADGVAEIPIEERDSREVTEVSGRLSDGEMGTVRITPDGVTARNFAFDVTPAKLVTGLITERGICPASEAGLASLYPAREFS
ncbi:MAG: S-methyl-5-thioribose-1-phosphate isomerase [Xanthomonadales bacterium]|nr:S-methyl-5-thioribose-1-phosphate isomerase [Gammaproteobacteria bacterium]MBT8054452.1 S-methyl-5-thioribose-1-phosphate isomerase [Gammaproteobacteria bacterium]NND58466.1 S-methyl-5-thioribose-1-phosphate isomerase [Xanthomonadales bacterium]NNK50113.1 S-methyl-5-thioribose-1-phosphate isomerase [Xanthomonadales bacterium]